MKTLFVSSADANYFAMLLEWVQSIRRFPESREMEIGIMDAGLLPEQVLRLQNMGCKVVAPEWPCPSRLQKSAGAIS